MTKTKNGDIKNSALQKQVLEEAEKICQSAYQSHQEIAYLIVGIGLGIIGNIWATLFVNGISEQGRQWLFILSSIILFGILFVIYKLLQEQKKRYEAHDNIFRLHNNAETIWDYKGKLIPNPNRKE